MLDDFYRMQSMRALSAEELDAKELRDAPLAMQRARNTQLEAMMVRNAWAYARGGGALVEVKAPPRPPSRLSLLLARIERWYFGF